MSVNKVVVDKGIYRRYIPKVEGIYQRIKEKLRGFIIVQMISSLTGLDSTKQAKPFVNSNLSQANTSEPDNKRQVEGKMIVPILK